MPWFRFGPSGKERQGEVQGRKEVFHVLLGFANLAGGERRSANGVVDRNSPQSGVTSRPFGRLRGAGGGHAR